LLFLAFSVKVVRHRNWLPGRTSLWKKALGAVPEVSPLEKPRKVATECIALYNTVCHTISNMAHAAARKKQVKTFSLADDVVEILEGYRKRKKVESLTSAVEELVREWRKADLAAQVTAYYDSLSADDLKRDEQWGKFSESQM